MIHRRFFTFDALEPRTLMATLSGILWNDQNNSQTYDSTDGESPIVGWTVYVDSNGNGRIDSGEATAITNRNGVYTFAGLAAGTYNVAVAAPSSFGQTSPGRFGISEGAFDISLRFDAGIDPIVRATFEQAAAKWESVIIRDISRFTTSEGDIIDDVRIDVSANFIDGPGGTLAFAGPDESRPGSHLAATGHMNFDPPDIATELANGEFIETVTHEMGHVLGFGTIWTDLGLLTGNGGIDPRFIGKAATTAYQTLFKVSDTKGVPVEADGGMGTAYVHWDEERFDEEMMTGYANYGIADPLSTMTVGSMQDLGYTVNSNAADTWDPFNHSVTVTSALDLGATPFERQVNLTAKDGKQNVNFGFRANRAPKLLTFTAPARTAIGRNITLSASNILDADGDAIAAVSFYRESNGIAGLQKGGDVYIGAKTVGKRGVFRIETSTDGLSPGDQAYYAVATDTQLTSGRRSAVVSLVTMPERPVAPAVVTGVSTSGTATFLSWTDSAGNEDGYRVQVSVRSDFARDALLKEHKVPADTTSLQIVGLKPGERYYYRVRAFNIGGSGAYTSTDGAVPQRGAFEILVDNAQATFTGDWASSSTGTGFLGNDYRVNSNGRGTATFGFDAARARDYALYVRWPASVTNAKRLSLTVVTGTSSEVVIVDQSHRGGGWVYVGNFKLQAGAGAVILNARGAKGAVIADAIRFI